MTRKLLIVDDQPDLVLILEREFARRANYQLFSATSAMAALALAQEKSIDLMIADVRLGNDSGFDLVRTIRGLQPRLPFILMSAYRSSANRQEAERLGALHFIEKPFNVAKLVADVDAYFHRPPTLVSPAEAPPAGATPNVMSHFKAQDLVQLFCLNGRAMALSVASGHDERTGDIYIQKGQVQHAELGELTGDTAFHAIMRLPSPRLTVKDWDQPVPQTITSPWEHLLIHSAIEADHEESPPDFPLSQSA